MRIFMVTYIVKDGGQTKDTAVNAGRSYDLHRHLVITATTAKAARDATLEYGKLVYPNNVVRVPTNAARPLGDA